MNHRLANLDLLRGLAALAVCAGHLRAFLFVDFGQFTTPGILNRFFYLVTSLGHQAVVVFFVLSGYLVGGSVLTAYQPGRWTGKNYAPTTPTAPVGVMRGVNWSEEALVCWEKSRVAN